jgi:hypothetical protein
MAVPAIGCYRGAILAAIRLLLPPPSPPPIRLRALRWVPFREVRTIVRSRKRPRSVTAAAHSLTHRGGGSLTVAAAVAAAAQQLYFAQG